MEAAVEGAGVNIEVEFVVERRREYWAERAERHLGAVEGKCCNQLASLSQVLKGWVQQ